MPPIFGTDSATRESAVSAAGGAPKTSRSHSAVSVFLSSLRPYDLEPSPAAAPATTQVALVRTFHLESMGFRHCSSLHPLRSTGAALCQPILDLLDDVADGHRLLL